MSDNIVSRLNNILLHQLLYTILINVLRVYTKLSVVLLTITKTDSRNLPEVLDEITEIMKIPFKFGT